MKKTPLIIGNWKLNPQTIKAATELASQTVKECRTKADIQVAVAPATIHLTEVAKKIKRGNVALAAQSVSFFDGGAHTGDISATQLKDAGAIYVLVGHSERRADEVSDEDVQKKVVTVLKAGCTPVVCIGEKERDTNGHFFSAIEKQIKTLTNAFTATEMKKMVIAYEPIWAIGTGKTATVEDVKEMQLFIYSVLTKAFDRNVAGKVRLLYGGSVKPHNAKELHLNGGMDGFLVGGASLKAKDFGDIVKATI